GEVKPGAVAATAPRYPSGEGHAEPSRAPFEAPRGGAPVPMYQAGMTRMVMPEEQARLRESPGSTPIHTPMPSAAPSTPQPDALARLSRAWAATGAAPLQLGGPERAFAETLAAVADAFARGLVELKNGLKEFGEGIGVRAVGGHSPLHRSQAASE